MRRAGVLAVLSGFVVFCLSVPMTAGAALTPPSLTGYGGSAWAQSIDDPTNDVVISNDPNNNNYDIEYAYQAYQDGAYYFLLEMRTDVKKKNSAFYYELNVGSLSFTASPIFSDDSNPPPSGWNPPEGTGFQWDGKYLEWKLTAADLAGISGPYTWWFGTYDGEGLLKDRTDGMVATPIPGAAWLLGTGLVGLIGLRRRVNGTP